MIKFIHWLLDLIYPPKCVICSALLHDDESDFCRKCRSELPLVEKPIRRGEFYETCWSVCYYEDTVAESVRRFKFAGMPHYADAYGRLLAMRLLRCGVDFQVLTWVPTSRKRKDARGYDQSFLLARRVAKELNVPCVSTLRKTFDNQKQSRLRDSAARRANVLGVYEICDEALVEGKRVLLIDDVITSGATLTECARVLLTAGASCVVCATFAATREKEKAKVKKQ